MVRRVYPVCNHAEHEQRDDRADGIERQQVESRVDACSDAYGVGNHGDGSTDHER